MEDPAALRPALARAALHVLAAHPPHDARLARTIDAPQPEAFDLGATVSVLTAALVVLQLEFEIERDPEKGWRLRVSKRAASEGTLKALLEAVAGRLKGPPDA